MSDQRKIPALQRVKLPRYGREGAVEVRPFTAETKLLASEAQGLSGEAMKGNPPTTVIPRVDESKSSLRTNEDSTEPKCLFLLLLFSKMVDQCVLVAAAQVSFDLALLLIGQWCVESGIALDSRVASGD